MPDRFHAGGGLFVSRLPLDGSVCLEVHENTNPESPVVKAFFVLPAAWASIVAHVSASGETLDSHSRALLFHQAALVPVPPPGPDQLQDPDCDETTVLDGSRT